jgi:hypothetical protein
MRARILAAAILFVLGSVARASAMPPGEDLAVAAFSQPTSNWELLAGYLPEDASEADPDVLKKLDGVLEQKLREIGVRGFTGTSETRRCEEIVLSRISGTRSSMLEYWVDVGKCADARYLLVPVLLDWRERMGGGLAVRKPARVVLDLYLVDAAEGALKDRFHYEETQRSLSENLLDLPKFLKRGGQWVTAGELAEEALTRGVEELGP